MVEPAPSDRRRFQILDTILLVAALAAMLSAERTVQWIWVSFAEWFYDLATWNQREITLMARSLALAELSLVLSMPILFRRGDRARLACGAPGLLVHVVVTMVVLVRPVGWLVHAGIYTLCHFRPGFYPTRWTVEVMNYLRDDLRRDAAIAVLATWMTLAIVGRWKPERAWDDRLGRLVGTLWVAFYLGASLLVLLPGSGF